MVMLCHVWMMEGVDVGACDVVDGGWVSLLLRSACVQLERSEVMMVVTVVVLISGEAMNLMLC